MSRAEIAQSPASSVPVAPEMTFPKLLQKMAADRPSAVALQEKRYGVWQPTTWEDYLDQVRSFAHGLADLGVEAGDVVGVIGDNRPEWVIAELAAQSIGAAVVGIYPTCVGEEIVHILTQGRVNIVIAEDQEQVDKLLRLRSQLPSVDTVIYYDPRGLEQYDDAVLRDFSAVESHGRVLAANDDGWFQERIAAGSGDDIAIICTTSGTTARPKLALLTHTNLLAMGASLMTIDPLTEDFRYVSFLPFAWIGEQMLAVACGLQAGFTVSFPEEAATQRGDLREIGPDVMFSPPRIWESMLSDVQVRLADVGWLKRNIFGWGYDIGDRVAERRVQGRSVGVGLSVLHRIAEWVALVPIREQLGLRRLKRGYTGGAPLGPDVFRFFHAIGINLKQIYGQTEICGIAVVHRDDDIRFHTVGTPIPGTSLRISDTGEVQLRSAAVFAGYLGNAEATDEALAEGGWLRTGDAGYLDEGHLVVIDRAKDVLEAPDGTRFSPAFIENKLKFSPYVEEAVIFGGEEHRDITAMITIDMQTVGAWAEKLHLGYTTYTDLAQKPEVYDLITGEVDRANADLPESIEVRRFLLLHKQLDPDDDEITRTRKVRRGVIEERYADLIHALAEGRDGATVTSTVTYQDGSSVDREISLKIRSMQDYVADPSAKKRPIWRGR